MIPIPLLINIGVRYILPFLIISTVLYGAYDWAYDRGYHAREAVAIKEKHDLLTKKTALVAERVRQERERAEQDKQNLIEVLNEQKERNDNLRNDLLELGNKRMFVAVKKPPMRTSCDREDMSGSGNTSQSAGNTDRLELSDETGKDIRRYGAEVQQRVNQLIALSDLIKRSQGECLKVIGR